MKEKSLFYLLTSTALLINPAPPALLNVSHGAYFLLNSLSNVSVDDSGDTGNLNAPEENSQLRYEGFYSIKYNGRFYYFDKSSSNLQFYEIQCKINRSSFYDPEEVTVEESDFFDAMLTYPNGTRPDSILWVCMYIHECYGNTCRFNKLRGILGIGLLVILALMIILCLPCCICCCIFMGSVIYFFL